MVTLNSEYFPLQHIQKALESYKDELDKSFLEINDGNDKINIPINKIK